MGEWIEHVDQVIRSPMSRIVNESSEGKGVEFLAESMAEKIFAAATLREGAELVADVQRVIRATSPIGIAAALRGMAARPDMTGELPAVAVPCLVVCGEEDTISTPAEMEGFARRLPQAQFVAIPGAGHMSPLENPTAVNAAVRAFLAQHKD